ncbi:ABC transporter substrate-binding protein [Cohnella sp. GCM10027633]|uniref:ABC transporter substrate-binding protein n=1 Tax=unclassified Cohnella TaxID=2636738 RepID=UPI003632ECAD
MKKQSVLFSTLLSLALVTTACGGNNNDNEPSKSADPSPSASQEASASAAAPSEAAKVEGEVTLFTYRDDLVTSWYPDMIKEFNQQYPDVKVTLSTSKNFVDDLKVKITANDVADIVTLPTGDLQADVITKTFLPLNDLPFVGNWVGNDVFQFDGNTYALTYGLVTEGLIYNKKIFNELSLTAPKTLDELIAAGKKIKESGKIGYVGVSKPGWTYFTYDVYTKSLVDDVQQLQKQMLESDAPFTADNPYVKTMNFIQTIAKAGIMEEDTGSYDWEPFKKDFQDGKSGMYLGENSMFAQLTGPGFTEADYGFVPLPFTNEGQQRAPFRADWGLAINKDAKNMEATKAFYSFLMDTKYADYAKKTGMLSANKNVTVEYPFLQEFEAANPVKVYLKPDLKEFKAANDKGRIDYTKFFSEIGVGIRTPDEQSKALNDIWASARK